MRCLQIKIQNFRNIEETNVQFSPDVNVFCGNNAQGKTNLLEAIFYGTLGKSFRDSHDANLVQFDKDLLMVSLDYAADGENARTQTITIRVTKENKKQIYHNGIAVRKISEFVGDFRTVLFCPDHLAMIKSGPGERRDFMDMAISQLYPNYLKSLQKYAKLLKQRNKLLKDAKENRDQQFRVLNETLDIWSAQLAHEDAIISWHRWVYLKKVNECVQKTFLDMTHGAETPVILYDADCSSSLIQQLDDTNGYPQDNNQSEYMRIRENFQKAVEEYYLRKLTENREREIGAGSTLYGVHKDDMMVFLNEKEARFYGSQGQQRSLALALKIAEGEISQQITGEYPIFLFDDVLSELDQTRRNYLLNCIEGKQVIMTSCEFGTMASKHAKKWTVSNGIYTEEA